MVSFVPSQVRGFTRGGLKITEGKGVALTVTYSKVINPSDKKRCCLYGNIQKGLSIQVTRIVEKRPNSHLRL